MARGGKGQIYTRGLPKFVKELLKDPVKKRDVLKMGRGCQGMSLTAALDKAQNSKFAGDLFNEKVLEADDTEVDPPQEPAFLALPAPMNVEEKAQRKMLEKEIASLESQKLLMLDLDREENKVHRKNNKKQRKAQKKEKKMQKVQAQVEQQLNELSLKRSQLENKTQRVKDELARKRDPSIVTEESPGGRSPRALPSNVENELKLLRIKKREKNRRNRHNRLEKFKELAELRQANLSAAPPPAYEDDDCACVVCLDASADYAVIDCGHQCLCLGCKDRVSTCPNCRAEISGTVKIFRMGKGPFV